MRTKIPDLMNHIYQALKRWSKYPLLATDTQVNSDLCWYQNSEITAQKEDFNSFIPYYYNNFERKPLRVAWRWIARDIRSLSSQSERALNAIHRNDGYLAVRAGGGGGGGKRNNLKPIQCVTDWRAQDPSTTLPTLEQSSIKNYDY